MSDKCPKCGGSMQETTEGGTGFWTHHRVDGERCLRRQLAQERKANEILGVVSEGLRKDIVERDAIIAKLPKTEDGVPITPGMKVWLPDEGAGPDEGFVSCDYISDVRDTGQVKLRWTSSGYGGTPPCNWPLSSECYSTKAAAEAARDAK